MENFRDFDLGPDPFGRMWHAQFKYLQTGISIRHADSIDVCFILTSGEEKMVRTVVISHPEMRTYTTHSGRTMSDTLCSRIAACKVRNMIETAEDLDKEYLVVTPKEIEDFDKKVKAWEDEWVRQHAA